MTGLSFTADSRLLAISSTGNVVTVWDTTDGQAVHTFAIKGTARDVAFSPDGKRLAAAVGKAAIVWDASTGAVANKIDSKAIVDSVEFLPDGRLIVKAGKLLTIDALGSPLAIQFKASPMSVSASPDGKSLLAPGGKQHAQLWDVGSGKAGKVFGEDLDNAAYFARFSPDGTAILTSDSQGVVRLWDTTSGELRVTWTGSHEGVTVGDCFSPDGRYVAAQFDEIRLYDLHGDANVPVASLPFIANGHCLAFSPDGAFLAAGSSKALMVWAL